MDLVNMVYQGTVWGPCLWNAFFGDVVAATSSAGFEAVLYADDLNCFKLPDARHSDSYTAKQSMKCRAALHERGAANQVELEPAKKTIMLGSLHA